MTGDDELDRWGLRIAEWAAPGETSLAAETARDYAAGGTARGELFRTGGLAPGGFGGGITTVLPELLDALAYAADAVKAALGSQQFANAVSAAALLVSLRARRDGAAESAAADEPPEEIVREPPEEIVRAALRMCERLRARGVDAATAEELVARLTSRLLAAEDRADAAAFLDALVANEPPEPAVRRSRGPLTPVRRLTGAALGLLRRRTASGADPVPTREESNGA
ncbi:hypothetical protein QNN03_35555 [Streptomyces sp. GXMU-J15]|uniref:Uncharacterized protein n=1 Tax=Streptomyces fuscus TaxID=3048495 RepID=A0ABT7JAD2_9ACTN|nr:MULTISPECIES: hypothetical protein [Streptomyces]MDL2081755.1 hypothetical protein [Streptomyces fuscus]SBT89821.1 hypothetical protein GA0115233_101275 [Streptomyces sp. DI166]